MKMTEIDLLAIISKQTFMSKKCNMLMHIETRNPKHFTQINLNNNEGHKRGRNVMRRISNEFDIINDIRQGEH